MLNRLGYSAGPEDGVWNKATGDAMLHFQQAHALEPTGNLNVTSIAALGLWNRLIGNPLGTQMTPAEAMNSGMPPVRGRGAYGMNDMGSGQGGYGQGGYGQGAYGGGMGGYGDGMAGALPSQRIDMNGANGGSAGGGAGSSGTNR
jgi:peptidoglycan hydrolase-like protein with peptidoglycan-binding domain